MSASSDIACPHASECPGCPLLTLPLDARASHKRARLSEALAAFALSVEALGPELAVPQTRYRTRAKLVVGRGGTLGLFARGTHDVLDLPGCVVLSPVIAEVADALRALVAGGELAALVPSAEGGALDGVDLRETREPTRAMATLLFAPEAALEPHDLRAAAHALFARAPHLASLHAGWRGKGPQLLARHLELVRGPERLLDRIADEPPHIAAAGAFVQAHRGTAAAIHAALAARLRPRARVLELHAGSGALALALAARGHDVVAVEAFAPAASRIEEAAALAGLSSRVRALVGDAEAVTRELLARGERFDAVLVDPPRRGLTPALREALASLAAPLGYVSCDPETLARDLADLARAGLAPERSVRAFDMMPLSAEVEGLAWLEPASVPPPRVIYEDDDLIAVEKAPHEPTTPHPESPRSLLARVRLLPGAEACVPVHRLDEGTSGVCLFARAADRVEALARALGEGDKTYVALVRGVTRAKGIVRRRLRDEGKERMAITRYRRLEVVGGHALIEVRPESGRTHQIRRHLAGLGHPVLGDARHGHAPSNRHLAERAALERTFLHCTRIRISRGGADLALESPLANDLALVLRRLRAM